MVFKGKLSVIGVGFERFAVRCIFFLVWVLAQSAVCSAEDSRPNVLFIAVDDLNHWVGHLDGHPGTLTPNIDELASEGVSFSRAYAAAPLCLSLMHI